MSITVPLDEFRRRLNGDSEFSLAARYWDGVLHFAIGSEDYAIRLASGEVSSVDVVSGSGDGMGEVVVSAPAEDWAQFLQEVPRPFFQDFYPASMHHGFELKGDPDYLWPYYGAVRRAGQILRSVARVQES